MPQVKIEVHNHRCKITEFPPAPWDKRLIKEFQRKDKNAYWQSRRAGRHIPPRNFISPKQGLMPTGILPQVLAWAEKESIPVQLVDKRVCPVKVDIDNLITKFGISSETEEPYELRWYQKGAVEAALRGHDLPVYFPRGLISVATAGGKTLISRAIIEAVPVPTIFIVERVNLANQTKKKLVKEYGMKESEVGVVGGKKNEQGRRVTITTIQSSHKLEDIERFQMLIVDESHHTKASTYTKFIKQLKNVYFRFGLSGTVFSGDGLDDMYRVSQFGDVIYEISTKQLVDEKVLAKPTLRFIEVHEPFVENHDGWQEQYRQGITKNFDRNNIIIRFAQGFEGKTLILFTYIEHGEILKKYLPNALYADGDTPMDTREKIFEGFNKMDEGIMIASTILDEGIDFERIHHVIIAGAGKSVIKGVQRLGRGLRKNDNMEVNVIDFFDRTCATLEKWSRARIKLYKEQGHKVKIFTRS
jgi:superfamily II DNA or RNA helicase